MEIGFGFDIERRGAEDWGMNPSKSFGGTDGDVHEMGGGGGVARGAVAVPLVAFAFGEIGIGVAVQAGGGLAIGLDAEFGVVVLGERLHRLDKFFRSPAR